VGLQSLCNAIADELSDAPWATFEGKKETVVYGVRYSRGCGIIYGFSLTETENVRRRFLLGRLPRRSLVRRREPLEARGSEPF
jgi:hypothetical protein